MIHVLRLVRFRSVGAGFDAALRASLRSALDDVTGLRTIVAGRIGPGEDGERILVSAWDSEDALRDAIADGSAPVPVPRDLVDDGAIEPVETLPIAIELDLQQEVPIAIIRVVTGITRRGQLDAYVADAREGTLHDRAAGEGPLALYLAIAPPDRFVTISLWGGWSHVEAATGADHEHVDRTRHAERLATWTAEHYEVIPGLALVRSGDRDVQATAEP